MCLNKFCSWIVAINMSIICMAFCCGQKYEEQYFTRSRMFLQPKSNIYFEFEVEYIKIEVENIKFKVEYIKIEHENMKFEVENL